MFFDKILAKPMYILAMVIVLVGILGIIYWAINNTPVVVAGDTVQVYYTGTFTNGTQFDSNVGKRPLQFTVGSGQVISGFDQAVVGMKLNQAKNITLPPNLAYGYPNPSLVISVPLSQFRNQSVHVGTVVTERTANGGQAQGVVIALNSTTATVNFNPPLAGKTLVFNIKVVQIQKASK